MIVTFISQCEKKALNRTRRVLDAFADRIGDNTWQTVITQEGLLAVKKLLRKTATKNTAVSCHWLRSRSRSELIWVVGSKDKFNLQGLVPVNTTQKEVPMDIAQDKPLKGVAYANTHLQRLDQHLFAVGYVAQAIAAYFSGESASKLSKAAFIAGAFHDIGKLDPSFQDWVVKPKNKNYIPEDGQHNDEAKFSFDKHPRHNEVSVLLFHLLADNRLKALNPAIKHAIYWHHAKPFRKKNSELFDKYGGVFQKLEGVLPEANWQLLIASVTSMLDRVSKLERKYHDSENAILKGSYNTEIDTTDFASLELDDVSLPVYKRYPQDAQNLAVYEQHVKSNALHTKLRAFVITADRWVSSLTAAGLNEHIQYKTLDEFVEQKLESEDLKPESHLVDHIQTCIASFPDSARTQKQAEVAANLAARNAKPRILAGAAGCGKTKIALEWAKMTGVQKLIWICPRVQICQGLFNELRNSDEPYLPNTNVELLTGEFKCINSTSTATPEGDEFTGDIVITTIDQILSAVVSHTMADSLLSFLSAHIVFDEFHEYITMPAFNLLLPELLACRENLATGANTLLVSATPHYGYINSILRLSTKQDKYSDLVEMPSFNPSQYRIQFRDYDETVLNDSNPLYQKQEASTFVISNTATTAQKAFLKNQKQENVLLLHSKFKKSDKRRLFDETYDSFKREGSKFYEVLRSGPIVQASLNISCDHMVTEISTAENVLQRLGRLDRFGVNSNVVNTLCVAIPELFKQGKRQGGVASFLNRNDSFFSSKAWYEFLSQHLGSEQSFTLPEIYALYRQFHEEYSHDVEQDLLSAMRRSQQLVCGKLSEPQTIVVPKNKKAKRAKISKNSLRGDTCFVQVAMCDLDNIDSPVFPDTYAYAIAVDEREEIDNLTESTDTLENNGILAYAAQKHARIDEASPIKGIPASRTKSRIAALKSYARDPEYPIFLSYTESDMAQKLGETSPYSEAIYYITTEKQAVGLLSLKHFLPQQD